MLLNHRLVFIMSFISKSFRTKPLTHILLVDDEPNINYLHEMLLQQIGFTHAISAVTHGEEALDFIHQQWMDAKIKGIPSQGAKKLILLDIGMPVMDGFEFMEALIHIKGYQHISVVILTCSSNPMDLQKARMYPFLDFLEKPLGEEKLHHLLEKV